MWFTEDFFICQTCFWFSFYANFMQRKVFTFVKSTICHCDWEPLDQGDSVTTTDSAVGIEDNFSVEKKARIEESDSLFEAKYESVKAAGYPLFPADNIVVVEMPTFAKYRELGSPPRSFGPPSIFN
jgi:hypothetical protein